MVLIDTVFIYCYFYECPSLPLPLPLPLPSPLRSYFLSSSFPFPPLLEETYRISHYYFLPWDSEEMCDLSDHQWRRDTFVHFLVISEGGSASVYVYMCACDV